MTILESDPVAITSKPKSGGPKYIPKPTSRRSWIVRIFLRLTGRTSNRPQLSDEAFRKLQSRFDATGWDATADADKRSR